MVVVITLEQEKIMNAWDKLDPTVVKPEGRLNPEDFEKPMVTPPSRPVPDIPQQDEG